MACRVRVRLVKGDEAIETSALVNSGFETDAPDIVIPVELAKRLSLWPPKEAAFALLDTGGGELSAPYYESSIELELVLGDREPRRVLVNVIVNPHVHEVLLSDFVASALGIALLDIKRGLWRLVDDPQGKVRETAKLEEW